MENENGGYDCSVITGGIRLTKEEKKRMSQEEKEKQEENAE